LVGSRLTVGVRVVGGVRVVEGVTVGVLVGVGVDVDPNLKRSGFILKMIGIVGVGVLVGMEIVGMEIVGKFHQSAVTSRAVRNEKTTKKKIITFFTIYIIPLIFPLSILRIVVYLYLIMKNLNINFYFYFDPPQGGGCNC